MGRIPLFSVAESKSKNRTNRAQSVNGGRGKAAAKAAAKPKTYVGSLAPQTPLPDDLAEGVTALSAAVGLPVWMLVQTDPNNPSGTLDYGVLRRFLAARDELAADGHVALLIDSPGGLGDAAYQIARILQRDSGFTVVIPRYAKSAATLLSLGAERAFMGTDAEVGPLDAQLWDAEREEPGSALNEVAALDRLHAVALEHLDKTMITMLAGTRRKTDVLLPLAAKFVSDMMRPMLEKIDAVHYAKQSRILAVAEQYAIRLLVHTGLPHERAQEVANTLVNRYPEHGFVIDAQEVEDRELLPLVPNPPDEVREAIGRVERALWAHRLTVFGKLQEQP